MLAEAAVSALLLISLLGGVFTFLGSSIGVAEVTMSRARIDQQATRTVRRLLADLRQSGGSTVGPNTGIAGAFSDFVEFRTSSSFASGGPDWSTTTRYEFARDPADPDDGVDNDGDGMIDEGMVVRRVDFGGAGERSETIARGVPELLAGETANGLDDNGNGLVDEPGFVVVFDGSVVTVRLTVVHRQRGGRLLQRTVESSVTPRN